MVLLFTGDVGEAFGYDDGWDRDGTFRYSGEGQIGDQTFTRGNAAIRDHAAAGKAIHLFHALGQGMVRYLGEVRYAGHEFVPNTPDRLGGRRVAIRFRLEPVGWVPGATG